MAEVKKENNNLELYNKVRIVPAEAKKTIGAGRLKGYTDINPMYRIKTLTEQFGPCGIGWKAPIKNKEIIEGANGEKIAIVDIDLFIKVDGEWSDGIDGTGGSSFIAKERNGLYTNDECFKMAYTDAISVACKSLGIGADVYWDKDRTKYDVNKTDEKTTPKTEIKYRDELVKYIKSKEMDFAEIAKEYKLNTKTTNERFKEVYDLLELSFDRYENEGVGGKL